MAELSRLLTTDFLEKTFKVNEIFKSIQGESTLAGSPCSFIRFTGCNLRCTYCDTTYAYDEGTEMTGREIVERVSVMGPKLVSMTGGEPLLQQHTPDLVTALLDMGHQLLIETNGTIPIHGIDKRAVIVLDVKTPASCMEGQFNWDNLKALKKTDEVKFVLVDRHDYEWAKAWINRYRLAEVCTTLFSPAYGILKPNVLALWILQDNLPVRLNLQFHKYIWGPNIRSV
jgi:7-carboxy-7-deazaguanine synthase